DPRGDRRFRVDRSAGSAQVRAASWWTPPQRLTWFWQLQGPVRNDEPVAAYDIDGFENDLAEVAALATKKLCAADNAAGMMGARFALSLNGKKLQPCWQAGAASGVARRGATRRSARRSRAVRGGRWEGAGLRGGRNLVEGGNSRRAESRGRAETRGLGERGGYEAALAADHSALCTRLAAW